MPLVLADRVKDTTTSTGTGTVSLSGTAPVGYQTFAAIGNGNSTYYTIAGQGTAEWEVGIGTYTSSGTTLSRDTVLDSSNAGALVNFSAGIKDVFVTYPAGKSISNGYGTLPVANGGTGATSLTSGYLLKGNGTSAVSASVVYESGGNVGIGTSSPGVKLDVAGSIRVSNDQNVMFKDATGTACRFVVQPDNNFVFYTTDASGNDRAIWGIFTRNSTANYQINVNITNGATYSNLVTGRTMIVTSGGVYGASSSSIKYKKDVEDLDPALVTNAIDGLRPVYYRTKNPQGDDKATWSHIGLIAEEVHEVEPRLVHYRTLDVTEETKPVVDDAGNPVLDEEGNPAFTKERVEHELETPEPEDVDYARLSVLLLAEVQSLRARVAALEAA